MERDLREARKSYDDVLKNTITLSSLTSDLSKSLKEVVNTVNLQAAFIGDLSNDYNLTVQRLEQHLKEAVAESTSTKLELKDLHERITRRRKEIDVHDGLVSRPIS